MKHFRTVVICGLIILITALSGCDVFEKINPLAPVITPTPVHDLTSDYNSLIYDDIHDNRSFINQTGTLISFSDVSKTAMPSGIVAVFITNDGFTGKFRTLNSISDNGETLNLEFVIYNTDGTEKNNWTTFSLSPNYYLDFDNGTSNSTPSNPVQEDLHWYWDSLTDCRFISISNARFLILTP